MFGGMECGNNPELAERILTEHRTLTDTELATKLIDEANSYDNIEDYFNEYRNTLQKIGELDENFKKEMVDKLEKSINIVVDTYTTAGKMMEKKVEKAKQKAQEARIASKQAEEISNTKISEAEAAEAEAVSAAAIFSSATEAVAGENKTIVDDFDGSDGYDDYDPNAYEEATEGEDISDYYRDCDYD